RLVDSLPAAPVPGVVTITTGLLVHGVRAPAAGLLVLTEADLAGQRGAHRETSRLPARRREQIDPLTLRPGDPVVHEQHGVGRYLEMVARTVAGATREYVVIEYAPSRRGQPGDRLYVPADALDQVTRYVGGDAPTLDRLGGGDWVKRKGRARKAVREIAGELIRLYSARMASPGFAFSPDSPWQRELEDAFPYVETPDQLSCIDEVKADMERPVPMDRLVCGDVGYGKTEVAVRAAFKAVQDGKQVAVLVPTTLLVSQHLTTFAERYAGFPLVVKALSRFQSDAEAAAVRAGAADGTVDVVIGTHRLLSGEVRFKDLGLVIIDEEQRFGVEHKEVLTSMRTSVDVLTMSATPIPRTMEMAVTGIREMSVLATPPEERHPVLTFVGAYDERQVTAAIRRELLRDGQVFYIHNRVESIDRVAERIRTLVPEARVAVAHGQLNERVLEHVIAGFWDKEFDVLVTTTIVENGLDISNANTLVVDRADALGLAQLYQLRGRVGRGRERAYAYFTYPPDRPLSETAHDRLTTIAAHTDLGSGTAVAMKDLEIRGSGNLLGAQQSGHIADVGFDLYVRMVGEAVAEFKGQAPVASTEVRIELPVDAHLPHGYIPGERLRLEAYRKLASVGDETSLDAVRAELVDRYGAMPEPVANLIEVARLRLAARQARVTEVTLAGGHVRLAPVELPDSRRIRLTRLYPGAVVKPALRTILVPRPTTARIGGVALRDVALLAWVRDLLATVVADPTPAAGAPAAQAR
ncbi:MAG: transcription-repair coupling factor, partial [Actinomycetes bacterium]